MARSDIYNKEYGLPSQHLLNKVKRPAKTKGKYLYYYVGATIDSFPRGSKLRRFGNAYTCEIEVTSEEWDYLFELDREEHNANHSEDRHQHKFHPKQDKQEEMAKVLGRKTLTTEQDACDEMDHTEAIHALEKEKRQIIILYEQGYTQAEIATQLGVTQSYISKQLKTALGEIDDAERDGDLTDIEYKVNKFWDMFIAKHKMPHGFDVIMDMFLAMLPGEEFDRLLKWVYGYREFLRTTLKYLLLYNGKEIDDNAENKLWKGLPSRQKAIYAAVFLDAPDSCKTTYLRLATEVERRRKTFKEEPKGSAFVELHKQVERIAKLRGVTAEEYLQKQFIPEFLKQKEKRYAQYRKEVKQEYPNILVVDEDDSRSIQEQLIEMFGDGEKPKIQKKK